MSKKNNASETVQEQQEPKNHSQSSTHDNLKHIAEKRRQEQMIQKGLVTREQIEEEAKRPPRPGALKMSSEVAMHTQLGVALFYGRQGDRKKKVPPIIGLARFANKVADVWRAAGEDDPYADHILLDIEGAYESALHRLNRTVEDVEIAVKDDIEMIISTDFMESRKPTVLKTQFSCPWAWRGLKLLKLYDHLVRMTLAGRHIGLYTNEDWKAIVYESARGIRHMFLQAEKWVFTGIGRENVLDDDDYAKQAQETYMKKNKNHYLVIDSDVVAGKRRPRLAPEIKGNPRAARYRAMKEMRKEIEDEEVKTSPATAKEKNKDTLKLKKNS